MKLITVAGPPSSGKTSILLQLIDSLKEQNFSIGVVKFDCLTSFDHLRYKERSVAVKTGLSGKVCPDHYFVSNIEDGVRWGKENGFDFLFTESAGLCNRCSPHIYGIFSICVIDNLSGINTPGKIGPMLKFADTVVITKGDIVSQAEREVFGFHVRQANLSAKILHINGITGQGISRLQKQVLETADIDTVKDMKLRFTVPAAICSYCTGEVLIGEEYQMGMMKKMNFEVDEFSTDESL